MPELPGAMRDRLMADHQLSAYDASVLTASRDLANYFDQTLVVLKQLGKSGPGQAKQVANWIMSDLSAAANREELSLAEVPLRPATLGALITRIDDGTISGKVAKDLFARLWQAPAAASADQALQDLDQLIETSGLKQINDDGALQSVIDEVIAANPKSVEQFNSGKDKALNALVGQVMKATQGKANPKRINELLRETAARG